MTPLTNALREVVGLLEKAWPGEWSVESEGKNEFGQREYSIHIDGDGKGVSCDTGMFYGDPDDANAAVAAVNLLRQHAADIERAVEDSARLDWLMGQMRCEDFCRMTGRVQGDPAYAREAIDTARSGAVGGGGA